MELIKLKDIEKIYGHKENKVVALDKVNLSINKGELVAIMGASGSGKSTLLNVIGMLDKPSNGEYMLEGDDTSKFDNLSLAKMRNKYFGFVVQHFALINDYTVTENIEIPLEYARIKAKQRRKIIHELLSKLGLDCNKNKTPKELSGGQCQRVAIARALANKPDVILADEPTGALDQKTGQAVINEFINLNKEGKTVIIVTHDPKIARLCDRIIEIEDGRIIRDNIKS